jgi:hypothetical protein
MTPTTSFSSLPVLSLLNALNAADTIEPRQGFKRKMRSGHPGSHKYHTDTKQKKKIAKLSRKANR